MKNKSNNNNNKNIAYDIRGIFEQMELDLIASMKRNLSKHEYEEKKQGFKFEQWQLIKLRELQRFSNENMKIVAKYSEPVEKQINDTLINTYGKSLDNANKVIKNIQSSIDDIKVTKDIKPVVENIKVWVETPTDPSFFRINDNKLNALIETVEKDFKNANAAVLRRMDDVYRQTIFKAQVHYNQGAITLDKAIDMATEGFLSKGIDAITYKDGKKVNIASYAEMALRTANHRAYLMGEGKKRQEIGLSLVIVSAHATSCELCVPWQGLILIDDVYSGGKQEDGQYPLLSKAMEEGFLHPNCRHNMNTYFLGITSIPKIPDKDNVLKNYQREQGQKELEKQIRRQKRVVEGTIDKDNLKLENEKLRQLQANLREYLKDNPQLRRSYRREKIY